MSDGDSQGQGEDQKNQGEDQGQGEEVEKIEMSKKKLSEKIIGGRNEGIEKGKKEALEAVNSTLGTDFESLDQVSETLSDKSLGDVDQDEVVTELQDKLKAKDEKIENISNKMQDIRTKRKIKKDVSEQLDGNDLTLDFGEVRTLVDSKYGYTEKDGEIYATKDGDRFLNDSGEYMTYAQAFKEYTQSRGLIEGGSSGGTGGGTNPKGGSDSKNPWVTGNATEQARMWNENPQKARRMKKQAGRK